jgi:molecular chaperone IbpA
MIHMVITTPFGGLGLDIDKFFSIDSRNTATYPPYNVIRHGDGSVTDEYLLEFAVAGFKKKNIKIRVEKNILSVTGEMPERKFEDGEGYLHKGIAGRKFSRSFTLPEYVEVSGAEMEDGILYINLIKEIPEEKKPKEITIS